MGLGSFVGGVAAGVAVGQKMKPKDDTKLPNDASLKSWANETADTSKTPTDAEQAANRASLGDAYADGGVVGGRAHLGKKPAMSKAQQCDMHEKEMMANGGYVMGHPRHHGKGPCK